MPALPAPRARARALVPKLLSCELALPQLLSLPQLPLAARPFVPVERVRVQAAAPPPYAPLPSSGRVAPSQARLARAQPRADLTGVGAHAVLMASDAQRRLLSGAAR